MDDTIDIGSEQNSVDFHRHCQGTILSVYGHQGDGRTTDIFQQANLRNLPSNWQQDYFARGENKTITHDLKSILEILDSVVGEFKQNIPTNDAMMVPFSLSFKDNNGNEIASQTLNPWNDASNNYDFSGFGRDIILNIEGQQVSFNTMTEAESDVLQVTFPKKTLSFVIDGADNDTMDAGSIELPIPNDVVVHIPADGSGSVLKQVMDVEVQGDAEEGQEATIEVTPGISQYNIQISDGLHITIDLGNYSSVNSGILQFDVHVKNPSMELARFPTPSVPEGFFVPNCPNIDVLPGYAAVIEFKVDFGDTLVVYHEKWQHRTRLSAPLPYLTYNYQTRHITGVADPNYNLGDVVDEYALGVDANAFIGNTTLTSISLPNAEAAGPRLASRDEVEEVDIAAAKLTSGPGVIGMDAFKNCTNLVSVNIPNVDVVGYDAFYGCSSLEEVDIGESFTMIGDQALKNCSNLREFNIPDTCVSFGKSVFYGCFSLESVKIPDNAEVALEDDMFNGCTSLKTVVLGEKVSAIAQTQFSTCSALEELTFPLSLQVVSGSTVTSLVNSSKQLTQANFRKVFNSSSLIYGKMKKLVITDGVD